MVTVAQREALSGIMQQAAAAHVLPRFRNLEAGQVAAKSRPDDLVTQADTEAETMISDAVRALLPEARVVGEEAVAADPSLLDRLGLAPQAVIVDPIDGTWNFAKGLPLFGMILAVSAAGRVTHGQLHDPLHGDWVEASDDGPSEMVSAAGDRRRLATSTETEMARMTAYIPLSLLPKPMQPQMAALFPEFGRAMMLRCSCHEYRMVAQGHAEVVLSAQLNAWDHAAGALAVRRAGGVSRMLDGRDYHTGLRDGYLLSAGCEEAWQRVAARLAFLRE